MAIYVSQYEEPLRRGGCEGGRSTQIIIGGSVNKTSTVVCGQLGARHGGPLSLPQTPGKAHTCSHVPATAFLKHSHAFLQHADVHIDP